MNDSDCVDFLHWALPGMRLYWPGFRKVRGQVCKRIDRRCRALGLTGAASYRQYLQVNPAEWDVLRSLCSIPISRFYRDRAVFGFLERSVLPALAAAADSRPDRTLSCWSAGCASGEEPYTLSILWRLRLVQRYPELAFRMLATDTDRVLLQRAAAACYGLSSLEELPEEWLAKAFEQRGDEYCVCEAFRAPVELKWQDMREAVPEERFDLVACRNVVLTYFEPGLQAEVLRRLVGTLRPGGALVVGVHEALPEGTEGLVPWAGARAVFRKAAGEQGTGG
jgi:chemotaxis protein methyltransferase CheR